MTCAYGRAPRAAFYRFNRMVTDRTDGEWSHEIVPNAARRGSRR
ncbi:hypothetical protein OH687_03895 [Burkholderia anthina]|nr:hypothetical protein OH687_03895 [Burkholderia anthina]